MLEVELFHRLANHASPRSLHTHQHHRGLKKDRKSMYGLEKILLSVMKVFLGKVLDFVAEPIHRFSSLFYIEVHLERERKSMHAMQLQ